MYKQMEDLGLTFFWKGIAEPDEPDLKCNFCDSKNRTNWSAILKSNPLIVFRDCLNIAGLIQIHTSAVKSTLYNLQIFPTVFY